MSTAPNKEETQEVASENGQPTAAFPVVGIGASAGGLRTFGDFFDALPANSGMAFVLVQHLDPNHESELAELLQNSTSMEVRQVEDGTEVEPNHVYVIPPGTSLTIEKATLRLTEPTKKRGHRAPIDLFFRSLADDQGENAVCIILSGTGSDGTLGLKAIKERGGVTMAQDPGEAEYDGMPRSAVATGLVDLVLPVRELAEKLAAYQNTASQIQLPDEVEDLPDGESEALQRIFMQLRAKTGHDFSNYKRSTILRRIGRRLQVNQIEDLSTYLRQLRNNGSETEALFKDFLISVTNFFRDPDAFDVLENKVIPQLFEGKTEKDQIRVWVPGCATGEEAYSIAILLCEYAATLNESPNFHIFATDIDEDAIAYAREGIYPENIAADVSPERLERFFSEHREGYQVKKQVREMVLFAVHNLIKDPPFSKLDLISCRNLLIYFNREVQKEVFALFHYALLPERFMMLGSSESTVDGSRLFSLLD
ncbi:MAG TPA: chemotaxis protein CheB, partial [Rhodothermales bacterium]|nr:chemotaxis protein CheB [Rhodothermales bacterium]